MRATKSNYGAYTTISKLEVNSRTVNILDILKKNKKEEKKEKIFKIATTTSFVVGLVIFTIFIYL